MFHFSIISRRLPKFFIKARPFGHHDRDGEDADRRRLIWPLPILRALQLHINGPFHRAGPPSIDGCSTCNETPLRLDRISGFSPTELYSPAMIDRLYLMWPNDPFRWQGREDRDMPEDLCSRCLSVDWSRLALRGEFDQRRSICILKLDDRDVLAQSRCSMCRFLGTNMIELDEPYSPIHLMLQPASTTYAKLTANMKAHPYKLPKACLTIGIMPHRTESYNQLVRPSLLSPSEIDFALLRHWMEGCQSGHRQCVAEDETDDLPGFQLIDCTTKNVIKASTSCPYVALSYVWGPGTFDRHSEWPLVVEDSITVALNLKYRYLWVDRYCINQEDEGAKKSQIAQMDRIYHQAELIIIAAAGDDPDYGLPGVSSRQRRPQATIELQGTIFINLSPEMWTHIRESTWASRAWTYQEGFLSRRRLIFTDYQVVFSCNTKFHEERIHDPRPTVEPTLEKNPPFMPDLFPFGHMRDDPLTYCAEFSWRDIAYESDLLDALSGVFTFIRKQHDFVHITGVPAAFDPLLGYATISLAWCHDMPGFRRDAYPSWSWLGWEEPIISNPSASHFDVILGKDFACSVVHANGRLFSVRDYIDGVLSTTMVDGEEHPKELQITAAAMRPQFTIVEFGGLSDTFPDYRSGIHIPLNITAESVILVYVYLDSSVEHMDQLSDCLALVLPVKQKDSSFCLLLVEPVGSKYRRIGLAAYAMRHPTSGLPLLDSRGNLQPGGYGMFSRANDSEWREPDRFKTKFVRPDIDYHKQLWFQDCAESTIVLE